MQGMTQVVKSMVFAMGWKGEVWADLEQAQTHKHQHQSNTNQKHKSHILIVWGGDSGVCTESTLY